MSRYALRLRIVPALGPAGVSCGSIAHIKLLKAELGLGLADAKEYIDRCVFGGETVDIPMASLQQARHLQAQFDALAHLPPKTTALVVLNGEVLDEEFEGFDCPVCGSRVPSFPELAAEEQERLRKLWSERETISAIKQLRDATGCSLGVALGWHHHPNGPCAEPALRGPLQEMSLAVCPECGEVTPRGTTSCFAAGCSYRLPEGHFASGDER